MPVLTTIFILLLSIILTIQSLNFKMKIRIKSEDSHKTPTPSLLSVMAIMIAYSWFLDYTGFLLTSAIVMFVLFWVFKVKDLKQISIITTVTLGILYVSFEKFLYAPLPVGILIENLLD